MFALFFSFVVGTTYFPHCKKLDTFNARQTGWEWIINCAAMSKTYRPKDMSVQRRLRPACASAQSDQSLRCPQEDTCILTYPKCAQWRFWSDCANTRADLTLGCAQNSEGTFPDVVIQFFFFLDRIPVIISFKGMIKYVLLTRITRFKTVQRKRQTWYPHVQRRKTEKILNEDSIYISVISGTEKEVYKFTRLQFNVLFGRINRIPIILRK